MDGKCTMFATDDETQKRIVLNIIPAGEWLNAISAIFTTKSERKNSKNCGKQNSETQEYIRLTICRMKKKFRL